MKSIYFSQHGSANVLDYGEMPLPSLQAGEVLVRLRNAALNHLDIWVRDGWPGLKISFPRIPGADGAGDIVELGAGVNGWKVGDRVVVNANIGCGECEYCLQGKDNLCRNLKLLGENINGTFCEFIEVPVQQLYKLPDEFDYANAAAAGLVYHTAWHSLISRGGLKSSDHVLIVGAGGGVNTASIVISKYFGAEVTVIGSSKDKLNLAKYLGADFLIDRTKTPEWYKEVHTVTHSHGADLIVDNVGTTFPYSFRAAAKGGRILTVGNSGGTKFEIDNRYVFSKQLSILGSSMGTREDFKDVMDLVTTRKLKIAIDHIYPLKAARAAQENMEAGNQLGKIVLEI